MVRRLGFATWMPTFLPREIRGPLSDSGTGSDTRRENETECSHFATNPAREEAFFVGIDIDHFDFQTLHLVWKKGGM